MLTDEIINTIYSNELRPKYSKTGKIILYALAILLANFTIYTLSLQEYIQAAVQSIVVVGFINEARSKRGYSQLYLQDLVGKLTEINLTLSGIKDNKTRVDYVKQFNYYIDIIVDRPNSVSRFELSSFLNDIKLHIAEEEEAERQGYHFTTEEEFEKQRRREEDEFQKRKAEYKRQQSEKQRENKEKQQQENREKQQKENSINKERRKLYFSDCFTMNDLNKRKKELLKLYHPDNHTNGLEREQCEQISKEINEAFVEAKDSLLNDF